MERAVRGDCTTEVRNPNESKMIRSLSRWFRVLPLAVKPIGSAGVGADGVVDNNKRLAKKPADGSVPLASFLASNVPFLSSTLAFFDSGGSALTAALVMAFTATTPLLLTAKRQK